MMQLNVFTLAILHGVFAHVCVAQTAVSRDSSGIQLIEVTGSRLSDLPRWQVNGPVLRIGDDSGDRNYELNLAAWPWRLSDGRIVVANDAVEVRFYDARGRHLTTAGRRGQGPGEHQLLAQLWRAPLDSLWVTDARASRVDVRGPDGRLSRSFTTPRSAVPAWLPDGSAIVWYRTRPDLTMVGIQRDAVILRRMHADGRAADTLAVLPGGWTDVLPGGAWRGVRLAGSPTVSSGTGGAVFTNGDQLAVHWFASDGRLATISRVAVPRIRVSNAEIRADERAVAVELTKARRLGVRAEPGTLRPRYADYLPQVSDVRLDIDGRAWVRRWARRGVATAEWIVFAPRGEPIARVVLPAHFEPNDIGRDYLLGIAEDEDGVQSVLLYQLRP